MTTTVSNEEEKKTLFVMRGIVATGKSTLSKKLAGDKGVICEEDDYFYSQVGSDKKKYNYDKSLLKKAGKWNDDRFLTALSQGVKIIVLDQGNSTAFGPRWYVKKALKYDYNIEIREPDSPWWQAIRECLYDKEKYHEEIKQWANLLYLASKVNHRVPYNDIYRQMMRWQCDITLEDILADNVIATVT